MNLQSIRQTAKALGIAPGKLPKTELIHRIQRAEGNFDCFGSANRGECDQLNCVWRDDCLASAEPLIDAV